MSVRNLRKRTRWRHIHFERMASSNVYSVAVLYRPKHDLSYIFCDYIIKNILVDIVGKIFLNVKIWLSMSKRGMLMPWNTKYVKLVKLNQSKKISTNPNNSRKNVLWSISDLGICRSAVWSPSKVRRKELLQLLTTIIKKINILHQKENINFICNI